MQAASDQFFSRVNGSMRPISWSLLISFARELDDTTDFFTVGVSTVGGSDIIAGTSDVLQLWDMYQYDDYSDRVLTMEWSQTLDPLYSVTSALGDITLDNHDDYLSGDNFALPSRPVRISFGFGNAMTGDEELLSQFVGITEYSPTIDRTTRTAAYHVIDFMSTLYNLELGQDVILTNVSTDEVLSALLQLVGLSPTQYDLDPGFNIIPVAYFPADTLFGDAANQLMQAEMGRFYMSPSGRITFKNRQDFSDEAVWSFDLSNTIDYVTKTQTDIINVVEITSNYLTAQSNQNYWQLSAATEIPAHESVPIPASFSDPVISVDTPVNITSATTSSWAANTAADGSGSTVDAGITLSYDHSANQTYIMTFTNTLDYPVWITVIQLWAAAAQNEVTIDITEENPASVAEYGTYLDQITNNFFTDEATSMSKALIILADNAPFEGLTTVTVKGNPAIEVNDVCSFAIRENTYIAVEGDTLSSVGTAYDVSIDTLEALNPTLPNTGDLGDGTEVKLGVIPELAAVIGVANSLDTPAFQQILTVKPWNPIDYFTVGISLVASTDIIAP